MKEKLRDEYRLIRKNIINKEIKDKIIFEKTIKNKMVEGSELILTYVSTEEEVDTRKLIAYFLKAKKVAVPRVENNEMNFYYINSLADLKKGYFNIMEPITNVKVKNFKNAVCLTPGICFSKDGYRIGYGKGFYDRFFNKNNLYKIGLCYKECLVDNIYQDEFDINVDEIIVN